MPAGPPCCQVPWIIVKNCGGSPNSQSQRQYSGRNPHPAEATDKIATRALKVLRPYRSPKDPPMRSGPARKSA
jgi:hypothetical protein